MNEKLANDENLAKVATPLALPKPEVQSTRACTRHGPHANSGCHTSRAAEDVAELRSDTTARDSGSRPAELL